VIVCTVTGNSGTNYQDDKSQKLPVTGLTGQGRRKLHLIKAASIHIGYRLPSMMVYVTRDATVNPWERGLQP